MILLKENLYLSGKYMIRRLTSRVRYTVMYVARRACYPDASHAHFSHMNRTLNITEAFINFFLLKLLTRGHRAGETALQEHYIQWCT